jgi:hypothetical protein
MIPFNVNVGGQRVGITFESLIWFFIVTALATLAGEMFYFYVQGYLPKLPQTNNTVNTAAVAGTGAKPVVT